MIIGPSSLRKVLLAGVGDQERFRHPEPAAEVHRAPVIAVPLAATTWAQPVDPGGRVR
jgi:hypothetical protein